ncbi:hypothetical protein [Rhizobium sp. NXC24]|uniref:hypothetical protein n=1 Tax=Rhizobium sp. NXC24 TaxID=2048897 RepID=UPI000CDF4EC8|nr:hypothetical protein [Rhizobium sp. NXC24]AVA23834.1 hypothetical protein NXC24_PA00188 [Rhizobium sp. NXC24]
MTARFFLLTAAVIGAVAISGCSHKPLKAPCARDEGPMQPMAFAAVEPRTEVASPFDACGPMKALNSDPSLLPGGMIK